jgi:hypothetical protein
VRLYLPVLWLPKQPLPSPPPPHPTPPSFPPQKINAASGERLAEARREIATMRALSHPSCLPLLDHAICTPGGPGGGSGAGGGSGPGGGGGGAAVLLLFPAFEDGTLAEELARLGATGRRMATEDVLDVFEQVGVGVGNGGEVRDEVGRSKGVGGVGLRA